MLEEEFIRYWKTEDFSTYNEPDVREDFIRPLLVLLGYSKNTVYDIIREKSLRLTEPYQRVGRQRVSIDYAPTIRLKSFWILEAKPGNVRDMDTGDLLQAYLYATHPEIQAQYVVLCNGWELRVYDVHQAADWDKPFFTVNQANCAERFGQLVRILSAGTMLEELRKRLLVQIQNTFEVELDLQQWHAFRRSFMEMEHRLETRIQENIRQLQREDFQRKESDRLARLHEADPGKLLGWMDLCGPRTAQLYMEYYKRIEAASPAGRAELLQKLLQRYWGRSHSEFKCDCLGILLQVVEKRLEVAPASAFTGPEESLRQVIQGNLTYHKGSPLMNALDYLDRTCCKFAYFTIRKSQMEELTRYIEDQKTHMAIDELLSERPTVAREMTRLITMFADCLWRRLAMDGGAENLWQHVRVLDRAVSGLSGASLPKYPDGDEDMLWYEAYGDHFDYLFRVSHILLRGRDAVTGRLDLDEDIRSLLRMDEEAAARSLPKMPSFSEALFSQADMERTLDMVVRALADTAIIWRGMRRRSLP